MSDSANDTARIEVTRKPIKCPKCGHRPVAHVLYGLPMFSPELEQDLAAGKTALGGCCISEFNPDWKCTACGCEIHRVKNLESD